MRDGNPRAQAALSRQGRYRAVRDNLRVKEVVLEALLLIRVAERRTGLTWRRIAIELGRLHAVTLTGSAGTVTRTTGLTDVQAGILRACDIAPPPRVTTLHPA